MPRKLMITSAPYQSSQLAIPPATFSPQFSITPITLPPRQIPSYESAKAQTACLSPPPREPLRWLWQCHICNRVYQLGVTRRFLDDGHFFCAGTTTVKRRKQKKHKIVRYHACASEFDYPGWKLWGMWRRNIIEPARLAMELARSSYDDEDFLFPLVATRFHEECAWLARSYPKTSDSISRVDTGCGKDCWSICDYPSECRWGKQYGVRTPTTAPNLTAMTETGKSTSTASSNSKCLSSVLGTLVVDEELKTPKTSIEDILVSPSSLTNKEAKQELLAMPETPTGIPEKSETQTQKPSMNDLLESAMRQKRQSIGQLPSPLAAHSPSSALVESLPPLERSNSQSAKHSASSTSALRKAFDEFELDVRKRLGLAGELMSKWASGNRSSTAPEDGNADSFVKGLGFARKRNQMPVVMRSKL